MTEHPVRRLALAGSGAAVLGAVFAVVLWLIGLPIAFAVAFGLAAAALSFVWSTLARADAPQSEPADAPSAPGKRSDVVQLSWALRPARTADGRVSIRQRPVTGAGARRVRRFAAARLRRHGVDLDDPSQQPRLQSLMGADVAAALASRATELTPAEINRCLDALDALDADPKRTPTG